MEDFPARLQHMRTNRVNTEERLAPENTKYFPVLDALRFVLALWVAIGHFGPFPLFAGVDTSTAFGRLVTHAWSSVFFGTPAVIVFFVISGFCIHLPYRSDATLAIGRYYLRRYTRILIPVAGALVVYRLCGLKLQFWGEHAILWQGVLWSLLCEEIYYAMYPLLRVIRKKIGWRIMLPVAFAGGALIAARHWHGESWHDFGPIGTAMILLPVWLLGCLLAEQSDALPVLSSRSRIWMWRLLIWLACWVCEMLHFKGHIHSAQTMIWFGVLAYFWVKNEIRYSRHQSPNRYLVAAGAWSYSLYLIHATAQDIFLKLPIPNLGYLLNWIGAMAFCLAMSYIFYLLVELPSHRLARKIKTSVPPKPVLEEAAALPG
jgi:peptidoglycan/LPS O-acetylase OafA/YrhL